MRSLADVANFVVAILIFTAVTYSVKASYLSESEPNDSLAQAQDVDGGYSLDSDADIGVGTANTSVLYPHVSILATGNNTFDYYKFTSAAGDRFVFDIDYGMPDVDTYIYLYDASGALLSTNDDGGIGNGAGGSIHDYDSYLDRVLAVAGTYYIVVGRYPSGNPVPTASDYRLHITRIRAPLVTTLSTTLTTYNSATLNGSVNPNGVATTGLFRYGTDPTLTAGISTSSQSLGSGSGPVSLVRAITGLLPHTTYYVRASATNFAGTVNDGVLNFTTLDRAPVANADSFPALVTAPPFVCDVLANDSDPDGDTLTVTAVTNGTYGTVTTDGATVTYTPGPSYHGNDSFTYTINDGFGMSATATVTIYAAPAVVTLAATSILPTGAVLNGTVNPLDLNTDAAFEIATVPSMAGAVVTSSQNVGSGFAVVPVSFPVPGLVPNTTYYYRIAATSSAGTARGAVYSFITPVIVWGVAGANAGTGTLDATIIPADTFTPVPSPIVYTNVAGQGYDIATTTYRLGAVGPATFPATVSGSPAWFFQGTAPNNSGYAAFTFRFFQTGTSNPVGVTGIRFRLEDAETGERFANFSYWDAIGNKITVPFTDSMFTYSSPPTYFNNGYGVINGAGYEGGTQTGKWIDIDLALRSISGFELLSHRETSSAGSVVMTNWGGGPLPMNVWRQAQFGGSWTTDSISGDFADPNGDGVINLLAYAFGIPPLGPTSGGLPVVGVSGGYATITFTRPLSVTDLSYHVEVSSDMVTWLPGSFYASTGDVPSNANTTQLSRVVGATTETIVVRDNVLIGPGSRYIRVRVTRP